MAVDQSGVADVLARFAGTLVGSFELDDVMVALGRDVARVLGVVGAGAMVADDEGRLVCVTASDERLQTLESLQAELDEGPCLLAFRKGEPVVSPDLLQDNRFPAFGPRAAERGLAAVYSFPMAVDGTCIGAMNVYDDDVGDLDEDQVRLGEVFAEVATVFLVHARDLQQREEFTAGLQRALTSRVVVEQAKGFVAARRGIDVLAAFELIRSHARSRRVTVQVVARSVLDGSLEASAL